MDRKQKKAIRMKILELLDSPNPDRAEIKRLGKLISTDEDKEKFGKKTFHFVDPDKYVELRNQGKSMKEIAQHFNCSLEKLRSELVTHRRHKRILPNSTPKGHKKLFMTKEEYLEKKEQGISDRKIAAELGFSDTIFVEKRREWGIETNYRHRNELISEEEYRQLKYQLMSDVVIAKLKGMSRVTLTSYKKRWGVI